MKYITNINIIEGINYFDLMINNSTLYNFHNFLDDIFYEILINIDTKEIIS